MIKRQGTNILMGYIDSSSVFHQFACAKSCSYTLTRELQEVSSINSGTCKEYIPMRYSWTMECSCLYANDNETIETAFLEGTALTVQWRDGNDDYATREAFTGTAYIKSLKASAQIHEMATFNISLQGSGDLTRTDLFDGGDQ